MKAEPVSLHKILQSSSPWVVFFASLLSIGLIGWLDHLTGWEYGLFLFYALPIALPAWKTDWRFGVALALVAAMTWWAAHYQNNPFTSPYGFALSLISRLFYFVIVAVAAAALKTRTEFYRLRLEQLERAQVLERGIIGASEHEQQRIGRDLHDGLGSHLAAIAYASAFLANDLRQKDALDSAKADEIHRQIKSSIKLLNDLVQGIFPESIEECGLASALQELAASISHLAGVAVSFHETGDNSIKDPEDILPLYRIAQEAVSNAIRHGNATKVTIVLSKRKNFLHLAIVDDGEGFAPGPIPTGGKGLNSMLYRARQNGGNLTIDSNPSGGTIVSCEIPLASSLSSIPAS